jgi:cathepsin D
LQVGITYGSGQVEGTVSQDTVSMGGFSREGQTILAVTRLSSELIEGSVSGIMGLAWTALASTDASPFWYNLATNGSLTSPDMSFWLRRETSTRSSLTNGGVFTLGGINETLYTGDIEFIPMPSQTPTFWLLGLSNVTVNGSPIPVKTGASAYSAIDTGTTLIGGPSDDVARIWAAVPGSAASTTHQGFYTFPCSSDVSIAMAFGGKLWTINTLDMNLGTESRGNCVGAIFDLSLGSDIPAGGPNPSWVVGATFLKNVYSVFRASSPPSIGFAQLSSAAGGGSAPLSSDASLLPASMIGITIAFALGLFNVL